MNEVLSEVGGSFYRAEAGNRGEGPFHFQTMCFATCERLPSNSTFRWQPSFGKPWRTKCWSRSTTGSTAGCTWPF